MLEKWSTWRNCFAPTFKQISARREGNRVIRCHEKLPQTPCQRIIDHCRQGGERVEAEALEDWRSELDPFTMKAEIEGGLARIWSLDRKLAAVDYLTGTEKGHLAAAAILEGHFRSGSMPLQNRKYRPEKEKQPNPNQDATKVPVPA